MKRRKHREDSICPHCGDLEDKRHIFTCLSPAVTEMCTEFSTSLRKFLDTCGCPPLAAFLYDVFFWARTIHPPYTTNISLQPHVHSQRRLGPHAATWGMYSPALIQFLQDSWTGTRRQQRSSSVWFSKLCNIQWKFLLDLWLLRNKTLHGPNNLVKAAESIRINQDILNLLEDVSPIPLRLLPRADRSLFRLPYHSLTTKSLRARRQWLQKAQLVYSSWLTRRHHPDVRPMMDYLLGAL